MACSPKWKLDLLHSSYWIGLCFALLWLPRLSDTNGRKQIFTIGLLIDLALYLVLFLVHDLEVVIGVLLCYGITATMKLTVGFVYLTELLPKASHTLVLTIWLISNGCFAFCTTLYIDHDKPLDDLIYIGLYIQATSLIGSYLLPESPKLLIDLSKYR